MFKDPSTTNNIRAFRNSKLKTTANNENHGGGADKKAESKAGAALAMKKESVDVGIKKK